MPSRRREGGDVSAIYVHAGAGFHSYQNEKAHLQICHDAASIAMAVLRNGGSAVDAVEIAIKLMEDREITNAGYGSNLTANGSVECDATIIDHYGRSGAVGAVSQIKNPISLARVILESSAKPLSLQRVPPNLLVSAGATDFAYENGIPVLPPDFLNSPAAKERWRRWRHDLNVARQKEIEQNEARIEEERRNEVYRTPMHRPVMIHPSQLISPPPSVNSKAHNDVSFNKDIEGDSPTGLIGDGSNGLRDNIPRKRLPPKMGSTYRSSRRDIGAFDERNNTNGMTSPPFPAAVSSRTILDHSCQSHGLNVQVDAVGGQTPSHMPRENPSITHGRTESKDHITDTVGAIAIDCYGNIAAGSSSGGIGMKHRGRIGPAALVGVGTAVIPIDPEDPDRTCVAAVTSGTGEHMTTTMAAGTCASRVYFSQRKGEGGILEEVSEDEAVKAMIEEDFMKHPGVRGSNCEGAIGVLAVKKTKDGVFLVFGHNTDSFVLASMSSEDQRPVCVMSRSHIHGAVAQGGRVSRRRR
ncbi:Nucleophile aminohydrolase [Elaphomyces granulatus]